MAKAGSIVFHLNSSDLESKGKADRLMTFYRQLLKNRRLTRFCKEAFIEKAERQLNGWRSNIPCSITISSQKG